MVSQAGCLRAWTLVKSRRVNPVIYGLKFPLIDAKARAAHVAFDRIGDGNKTIRPARNPAAEYLFTWCVAKPFIVMLGDKQRQRFAADSEQRQPRIQFRRRKMRMHKIELRPADEPTESDKRFQLAVESK